MKRDWNEIRALLEAVEQDRFGEYVRTYGTEVDTSLMTGPERRKALEAAGQGRRDIVLGHLELLKEAGLVRGIEVEIYSDDSDFACLAATRPRLTMEGYDLLDHLRDKPFRQALEKCCKGLGIELTFDVIRELVPQVLRKMGL